MAQHSSKSQRSKIHLGDNAIAIFIVSKLNHLSSDCEGELQLKRVTFKTSCQLSHAKLLPQNIGCRVSLAQT